MPEALAGVHHHQFVGRQRNAVARGVLMHHGTAPHVAQDLIVDVFVEAHQRPDAEIGVIEDGERPKGGIGPRSEDEAGPHAPDLEWSLLEAVAGLCAHNFQHFGNSVLTRVDRIPAQLGRDPVEWGVQRLTPPTSASGVLRGAMNLIANRMMNVI
jgi:hypothetical protein